MNLVILQPMFIPWAGVFEQIKLADTFVHYDDALLPKGRSFISRVQIKATEGVRWLTIPIDHVRSGRLLKDTWIHASPTWRRKHLETLRHCYSKAPYFEDMFDLAQEIYSIPSNNLLDFNCHGIARLCTFLKLSPHFVFSSDLSTQGTSTEKLVNISCTLQANTYITGHGALNYLDHSQFEDHDINVHYMDYKKLPYPQLHGTFTPFVSILDGIANCGNSASHLLCSNAIYWKDFINESRRTIR